MNWQRLARATALFGILVAVYFFTYTGEPLSNDEVIIFDASHSLINGRGIELAYTNMLRPYNLFPDNAPVITLDTEPLQAYAALPLLWLARLVPGIGMMQAAWTLNIFVTALTAVVLFYYGLALGYRERTALLTALIFGLATYAWVYSKLFFREPLFSLLILSAAYCLERWRQSIEHHRVGLFWLTGLILSLGGALLAKEATLVIVPALIIIGIPSRLRALIKPRIIALVLAGLVGIQVLISFLARQNAGVGRYNFVGRFLGLKFTYLAEAFPAYLFSPGLSPWFFSPVLITGFAGFIILLREKRIRQALVPLVVLFSFTLSYSILQGANWYGGLGWGPRYLLPTLPFMMLWILPVVDHALMRRLRPWQQAAFVGITACSVFVQVMAVSTAPGAFTDYLYSESDKLLRLLVPWQAGVWNPVFNPIPIIAQSSRAPSPAAWALNQTGSLVIPLVVLTGGICLLVLIKQFRSARVYGLFIPAVVLSLAVTIGLGLHSYYLDPRFIGTDPVLFKMLDRLNSGIQPGDAVLLNNSFYAKFFMNYYKRSEPLYILPDAPGERPSSTTAPEITTDNPEYRAHANNPLMLSRIAAVTHRWWFLTESGPFSPGKLRPTENYLVRHYFPIEEVVSEPSARLILFSTISAPPDVVPPWPQLKADANFGPARLVGFDLPFGDKLHAGGTLPVSLLWTQASWSAQPFDYSINVSLVNSSGAVVAQRAVPPLSGFAPMSQWIKGAYYRDNHGLALPPDLPPGDYQLWVLVYDWSNNTRLPLVANPNTTTGATNNTGTTSGSIDHAVIATIHIVP